MIQPHCEPLRATLVRTLTIAVVVGAMLAWRWGGLTRWPVDTLLVLWISLGGHFVELIFLNGVRPRQPGTRLAQIGSRLGVWFIGGTVLTLGMRLTAMALDGPRPGRWPAWWVGGLAFIGIELLVHLVLVFRRQPNFYDGRG